MMAMGNGDRPGWIIIGIATGPAGEAVYAGLDDADAKSFDPTPIGEKVWQHSDPEIEFEVHRVTVDGRWYVAIRVAPFPNVPYVCRAASPRVLDQGAFYIRTEAAQSVKINRAEQMRRILDRATRMHADSIVRRIEQLIDRSRSPIAPASSAAGVSPDYERLLREMRRRTEENDD
jgi:predicted HTH transcriptional regulator